MAFCLSTGLRVWETRRKREVDGFFFFFIGICKTNIYIFLFYSFWVLLFFVVLHAKARLSRAVYFEGDSIWNRNRVVICVEMSLLALCDMYSILALSVINTFRMLIARNINAYIVVCSRYDEWRVCVDEMKWESEKFHRHRLTFCISTAILSSFIRQNEKWAIGRVIMVRVTGLITCRNTRESQRTAEKKNNLNFKIDIWYNLWLGHHNFHFILPSVIGIVHAIAAASGSIWKIASN